MDNFIEYMWYLLTTPFKKVKKSINKWYILCRVWGKRFDDAKEAILQARDEGMVATCSHEMLPVHAADRGLTRYKGEHPENFRKRIAMYEEVCVLGGLNEGILKAVRSLGYTNPQIERAVIFRSDPDRWAEFYLVIIMDADEEHPISFDILRKTVRKWKEVEAKDNYYFEYKIYIREPHDGRLPRIEYRKFLTYFDYLRLDGKWETDGSHLMDAVVHMYRVCVGFHYKMWYLQHQAALSMAAYRTRCRTVEETVTKMLYQLTIDYFSYLKLDGSWQTDGSHLMDARRSPRRMRWAAVYRVLHDWSTRTGQLYRIRLNDSKQKAGRITQAFRLTSDYFSYLKLNGLWKLTGSRMMDSQRSYYNTRQAYSLTTGYSREMGGVTWHEEHNLFFLDGTWSLDGSKTIDAFQKTEVL